ncbi:MAG: AAA family ATPase, partial [Klebsiella sp.]|nr:AAA family ATPase [Klebsiella sp.]
QLAQRAEPMRLGPVFTVDQQKPLEMAPVIRWLEVQMQ